MLKKKLIAITSFGLALLVCSMFCGNTRWNQETKVLRANLQEVGFEYQDMEIKPASDFAGNQYLIGDSKTGNGYFIYNIGEEIITEFSYKGNSPYYGYESKLIYGGVKSYFIQEGENYVSISNEKESYKVSEIAPVAAYNTSEVTPESTLAINDFDEEVNVKHASFFSDDMANRCGEFSVTDADGCCGYVALGMLVGYVDKFHNNNFMDDKYYGVEKGLKGEDLSIGRFLYDLYPKNGTISTDIKKTMEKYITYRNGLLPSDSQLSVTHVSRWTPFLNDALIYNAINNDIPVILFGSYDFSSGDVGDVFKTIKSHAVVAYGVKISGSKYYWRCHIGWNHFQGLYSDVYIVSGTTGSLYYFVDDYVENNQG